MRDSYTVIQEYVKNSDRKQDGWLLETPLFYFKRPLEIAALQALIRFQIHQRPNAEEKNGGWFTCSLDELRIFTGLSNTQQARYLCSLEGQGFIKRKRIGSPGLRQIWIDFDRWYSLHEKMSETWWREYQKISW